MKKYFYLVLLIILVGGAFTANRIFSANQKDVELTEQPVVEVEDPDIEEIVHIESGMTFSDITEMVDLPTSLMQSLYDASKEVYDLVKVRVGRDMVFVFDKDTKELKQLIYPIDTEEELHITKSDIGKWQAERKEIAYETRTKTVEGVIDSSLYESALEQGIDIRAIIDLADVFAWTIDFGMGIRVGDTYKFIYEERYRNGEYVMPGKIIAAKFVNDGKLIEGYYFSEGEDEDGNIVDGYYAPDGSSLQKIFLKNPVNFKYISSGFTTGRRYVEAFNVSTGHRAIDYAAAIGTPIRAVGDGTVTFAGWNNQGYGYLTSIRHNSVFSTNYAHQSRMAVSYGQKVTQGQIIGYVGSTGFSTGPHLHFEMVKNGTKINPMTVDIPSDKAVSEDKMEEFKKTLKTWQSKLN